MKLATLDDGSRDGKLLVVSRDLTRAVAAEKIAPTLQLAMDRWRESGPALRELYARLEKGPCAGEFALEPGRLHSPFPRAYGWVDGSAYINHIVLVRKARGAEPPPTLETDPLMYQGGSDSFLRPTQDIIGDVSWGIDFESEVAVVTGDVPMGASLEEAREAIRLVLICNDVSLRNLIPEELAKGFGFLVSKPSSAFAPVAVTPDELGSAWKDSRVHLPLITHLNGDKFGDPDAGPEMHFNFAQLIAHAARTRPLAAGTIVGSGTVSNLDRARGSSCLAERRMIEKIDTGEIKTPFMQYGDTVTIEMLDSQGHSIFGRIHQKVVPFKK